MSFNVKDRIIIKRSSYVPCCDVCKEDIEIGKGFVGTNFIVGRRKLYARMHVECRDLFMGRLRSNVGLGKPSYVFS